MFDYQGYGKTPGNPTENGVKEDAKIVYDFLRYDEGYSPDQIIIYGNSLGSSIAAWLVDSLEEKPRYLVMQSSFSSYRDIVSDILHPILSHLCTLSFDSSAYVKSIGNTVPILIIHSPNDHLINIRHSKRLLDVNVNAKFYQITGTHNRPHLDDKFFEYFNTNVLGT